MYSLLGRLAARRAPASVLVHRLGALRRAAVFSAKTATELKDIRNVGIVAHVDHGKTTLTERILYLTGMVRSVGGTLSFRGL